MELLQTSEDWSKDPEFAHILVLDPDGWDRRNYQYSWHEEKISRQEYRNRMMTSTVMWQKLKVDVSS